MTKLKIWALIGIILGAFLAYVLPILTLGSTIGSMFAEGNAFSFYTGLAIFDKYAGLLIFFFGLWSLAVSKNRENLFWWLAILGFLTSIIPFIGTFIGGFIGLISIIVLLTIKTNSTKPVREVNNSPLIYLIIFVVLIAGFAWYFSSALNEDLGISNTKLNINTNQPSLYGTGQ